MDKNLWTINKLSLFIVVLLHSVIGFAQLKNTGFYGNQQPNDACESSVAFVDERNVMGLVTSMCEKMHIKNRYIIKSCSHIANCQAIMYKGKPYILYNSSYLEKVKGLGFTTATLPDKNIEWTALTILAHELGHHVNLHLLNPDPNMSNVEMELEADEFAGHMMRLLGATLKQAQSVMYNPSITLLRTYTHPGREERLLAIKRGWDKSSPFQSNEIINPDVHDTFCFDNTGVFSEGLVAVEINRKSGFINRRGEVKIPYIYEMNYAGEGPKFISGLAPVGKNGIWGYIDTSGKELGFNSGYVECHNFRNGLAAVAKPGISERLFGYVECINKDIHMKIGVKYRTADDFTGGIALVSWEEDNYYNKRCIDIYERYLFSIGSQISTDGWPYDRSRIKFSGGFALIHGNGFYGFIDRKGKKVIDTLQDAFDFSDGVAPIEIHDKWYLINEKLAIVKQFSDVESIGGFFEGYAKFENKAGLWGFIDHNGNKVIQGQFEDVGLFSEG